MNCMPSRDTLQMIFIVTSGVTLIGATTYYFVSKKWKKQRSPDQVNDPTSYYYDEEYQETEVLYDDIYGATSSRRLNDKEYPAVITFPELLQRAKELQQQRQELRKTKLYFDSNDEFITEDVLPEMTRLYSQHDKCKSQAEFDELELQILNQINRKYNDVMVFFGNDEHQISGTTKITRHIFQGTRDRNENAILFLENLNRVKQNKF